MAIPLFRAIAFSAAFLATTLPASAQMPGPMGPPKVGVITVESKPVIDHSEFSGRVQSTDRVALIARVTAFMEKQLFRDGADVKKGELLYVLERGPFEADLENRKGLLAQQEAQAELANLTLTRAQQLLDRQAGPQSTVDSALAAQRSAQAQIASARAQVAQAQINLDYTEIRSPIEGRINRTSLTVGNVVGPTSGTLATVVSQDPMYVVFPMPVRALREMREKSADKGGLNAVEVRLRLANGRLYEKSGKINFVDTTVAQDTDSIMVRAVIANPPLAGGAALGRELINDEFVTVVIESAMPQSLPSIPRAVVMADQQGDYVYVLDARNVVTQRRIRRGASTPRFAAVEEGLKEGDVVILEGVQRVRPGMEVAPQPAAAIPGAGN
ncbi:MAG: efflux RND transporter periplasmic adaptor subunit [Alphaproteobacteria bacterium]|nr:efflux RND transporter periplasmic adaptor subunit [Alphaproteobacteria bacterium]